MHSKYTEPKITTGNSHKHLMYVPFTGLGLYGGFRGNRWLKNRIKIFKQFVIPSLLNQSSQDFTLWISWRPEERSNPNVKELKEWLSDTGLDFVFTYTGVCFYDDKHPQDVAQEKLITALHGAMGELINLTNSDWVLMTIQPSDDCYHRNTVEFIQQTFKQSDLEAVGFEKGYLMNYQTKELAEWNPKTNPPFYTIKFPRAVFIDPLKHAKHTALKKDVGDYKAGTPLPSHEYVGDCLKYGTIKERGFLVGTHGENISTIFNHPYRGEFLGQEILEDFGLKDVPPLKISYSIRKRILRKLPHRVQRKLRYIFGEKIYQKIYEFLRS